MYGAFTDQALLCQAYWDQYDRAVDRLSTIPRSPESDEYRETGYKVGDLDTAWVARFWQVFPRLPRMGFAAWDSLKGYFNGSFTEQELAYIDRTIGFRLITEEMRWVVAELTEALRPEISKRLLSPWRVLNTRIWSLENHDNKDGLLYSNAWHTDGLPDSVFKVMIYPHPIGPAEGTVKLRSKGEVKLLENSAPGTWLLFESSKLLHRGVYPEDQTSQRVSLELTITRSIDFDTCVYVAGNNANYPLYPWIKPANRPVRGLPLDEPPA